jgi:hypothetical protein
MIDGRSMSTNGEECVIVSYRPLATLDALHRLLLAAVTAQTVDVALLADVFSIPERVVGKELSRLALYGLAEESEGLWSATKRGRMIVNVWECFGRRSDGLIRSVGQPWVLGPGTFAIDARIRDRAQIIAMAGDLGITEMPSAIGFLHERWTAEDGVRSFLKQWPREWDQDADGVFGEVLIFAAVHSAENDEAIAELEELLDRNVRVAFDRLRGSRATEEAGDHRSTERVDVSVKELKEADKEVRKTFRRNRGARRHENQKTMRKRAICEALLMSEWVSANAIALRDAFEEDPSAFQFTSRVPLPAFDQPPGEPPVSAPQETLGDEQRVRTQQSLRSGGG